MDGGTAEGRDRAAADGALLVLFEHFSRHCLAHGIRYAIAPGPPGGPFAGSAVEVRLSPASFARFSATFRSNASTRLRPAEEEGARCAALVRGERSASPVRVDFVVDREESPTVTVALWSGLERVLAGADLRPASPLDPATRGVPDFGSLAEGLRETGGRAPFRVPGFRDIDVDARRFDELLASEQAPIRGRTWGGASEPEIVHCSFTGAELAKRLREGSLAVSVIDSPVGAPGYTLPETFRAFPLSDEGRAFELCYALAPSTWVTPFHVDPPYGGGWVYLIEGEKLWWLVDPADAAIENLGDRGIAEALVQDGFHLWGKIYVMHQTPGSLVYFPPRYSHRVTTYARAFGFGGYLAVPPQA